MNGSKTCFIACPIGSDDSKIRKWSDRTFKYIIKPVVEKYGYNAIRADHIKTPGIITNHVIEQLYEADLVIADLADHNPNVFYELSIRHSTHKPYIQMIKIGQKIPFDINGMRTIFYDTDLKHVDDAKNELAKQIEAIEIGDFKATNPINIARNYLVTPNFTSNESNIKDFRRTWHMYHITKLDGKFIWRYMLIDFSKVPFQDHLKTNVKVISPEDDEQNHNVEASSEDEKNYIVEAGVRGTILTILTTASIGYDTGTFVFPCLTQNVKNEVYYGIACISMTYDYTPIISSAILADKPLYGEDPTIRDKHISKKIYEKWLFEMEKRKHDLLPDTFN